jgi:hypothetical protein
MKKIKRQWPSKTLLCSAKLFCIVQLLMPSASAQPGPERLGTLFYSPAERSAIVSARKGEISSAAAASAITTLVLTGVVKRSGQKGTVWINGQPMAEGQAIPAAGVPLLETGRVIIDGKPVRVREGLDVESGARTDALPPGAVSVKSGK